MDHDDREMPGGDGHLVLHVHLPSRDAPRVGNLGASGGAGQAVRLPDGAADEEAALRLDAQRAMRVDRLGRAARGNKQPAKQEKCCRTAAIREASPIGHSAAPLPGRVKRLSGFIRNRATKNGTSGLQYHRPNATFRSR
jgi:hypothetical protein